MNVIDRRYIVDENNRKVAVQIPIEAFEKLEEILEDYALVEFMKEYEGEEMLDINEAKAYYDQLEKSR
ncbi:MAG: hypothetical protein JW927_05840 [Deltaproteobacteria bacterium]|nr:hypothetical protein [Deltaproteobacteria bacterium]